MLALLFLSTLPASSVCKATTFVVTERGFKLRSSMSSVQSAAASHVGPNSSALRYGRWSALNEASFLVHCVWNKTFWFRFLDCACLKQGKKISQRKWRRRHAQLTLQPLSVKIYISVRKRPLWATWAAEAVREPTMFVVTEPSFSEVAPSSNTLWMFFHPVKFD